LVTDTFCVLTSVIIKYETEDLLHYDTVHCSAKSRTLKINSLNVDIARCIVLAG
jgi:hypothetical protein